MGIGLAGRVWFSQPWRSRAGLAAWFKTRKMKLLPLSAGINDMKATFVTYSRLLVIGLACAAFQAGTALAKERQETHQTYPLTPDGQVHIDNVNGKVHITA